MKKTYKKGGKSKETAESNFIDLRFGGGVRNLEGNEEDNESKFKYLRSKKLRAEDEDEDINSRPGISAIEIINQRKTFYERQDIKKINNKQPYLNFLKEITSKEISSTKADCISSSGLIQTYSENLYEKYSFLNTIEPKEIFSNSDSPCDDSFFIFPNSIFLFFYEKIIMASKQSQKFNKIFFVGEKGCGKTYAIMLLVYVLRLNPYNVILPIFNARKFIESPKEYFIKEIIFSLGYLFSINSQLSTEELSMVSSENFYQSLSFQQLVSYVFDIIARTFEAFKNEINFYFFVDCYEEIEGSPEGMANLRIIYEGIESLKLDSFGMIKDYYLKRVKSIEIGGSDSLNSDIMIKNKIEEYKSTFVPNKDYLFNYGVVFVNPKDLLTKKEIEVYIQNWVTRNNIDKAKTIFQYLDYSNFSLINKLLINKLIDEQKINEFVNEDYKKLFDSFFFKLPNEDRLKLIYNVIYSYTKIKDVKEDLLLSFFNNGYLNYNYSFIIPYLSSSGSKKEEIRFFPKNKTVENFINSFEFDDYFAKINFDKISSGFYEGIYKATKSPILRGILLEELTYMKYKSFHGSIQIPVHVYCKTQNCMVNNRIKLYISKVVKSHSSKTDIFLEEDYFYTYSKEKSGMFFLSIRFPCIDFVIFSDNCLFLVQMKKTLKYEHIIQIQKDLHFYFLLMSSEEVYKELEQQNNYNNMGKKFNTKLNFWLTIARIIKKNPRLQLLFMFVYQNQSEEMKADMKPEMSNEKISEKLQRDIVEKKEVVQVKLHKKWEIKERVEGSYSVKSGVLEIECYRTTGNIILTSLDNFISPICKVNEYFRQLDG